MFNFLGIATRRFPYRSATVTDRIFTVNYHDLDYFFDAQKYFCKNCGKSFPDNHECYAIQTQDGKTYYVQFSDYQCYIGLSIEVKDW